MLPTTVGSGSAFVQAYQGKMAIIGSLGQCAGL